MKFIKKFVGLTFVLSVLIVCFMSSTMVAHADGLCPACGNWITNDEMIHTCVPNPPREEYNGGGSDDSGGYTPAQPAHTHSYGPTSWGAWV